MIHPQLVEYFRAQRELGVVQTEIAKTAMSAGWSAVDIADAMSAVAVPPVVGGTTAPLPPSNAATHSLPSSVPTPPPPGEGVSQSNSVQASPVRPQSTRSPVVSRGALIVVVGLLLIGAGVAYAYVEKLGPFSRPPYTDTNLLTGLLERFATIKTSTYAAEASFNVGPRDADATSFEIDPVVQAAEDLKYKNDYTRIQNVRTLLGPLITRSTTGTLPTTIKAATSVAVAERPYSRNEVSDTDPVTHAPYGYAITENGRNFALTVTFETTDAVLAVLRSRGYAATTTKVEGKTVTFTKMSPAYLYLSSVAPKPFPMQLGEWMRSLPIDAKGQLAVSALADWSKKENADWKFNFNASADFGDLTFKIDTDVLRKNELYYLRVNNMPSLLLQFIGDIKNKWITIDPSASSTRPSSSLSSLTSSVPELEKNYKESRAKFTQYLRDIVRIADETRLYRFKNAPRAESIGGRTAYRYDLALNRDAVLPFFDRVMAYTKDNPGLSNAPALTLYLNPSEREYLQSPAFQKLLDQYENNTNYTLWVDPQGYPARIESSIRIVPPKDVPQFQDKQVNIIFSLDLSGINQSVDIEAPEGSISLDELVKQQQASGGGLSSLDSARMKSRDARRVADIKQIQMALELYYDAYASKYPSTLSALAPKFIPSLPKDPGTNASYIYKTLSTSGAACSSSCPEYVLSATLEDGTNSSLRSDVDGTVGGVNCADTVKAYCVQ